jgi:hypothetical protein
MFACADIQNPQRIHAPDSRTGRLQKRELMAHMLDVPHTEREYEALVALLDALIDRVGEDETHSLASLMEDGGSRVADRAL